MIRMIIWRFPIIFAILLRCHIAAAQNQKAEFLDIANATDQPIWVSIKATGEGTINTKWQPEIRITPGNPSLNIQNVAHIPLKGFEPFDIFIRQENGECLWFKKVNVCTMMRECVRLGQKDWTIRSVGGRWVTKTGSRIGEQQYIQDSDEVEHQVQADGSQVTIPFYQLVGKKSDDPFPPAPQVQPRPRPQPQPQPQPHT
jgi:hypothetical protein